MLPAILMLKISPNPWSNINSADILESMQLSMAANGNCPEDVSLTCCNKFLWAFILLQIFHCLL
jgi:hypothetical protein